MIELGSQFEGTARDGSLMALKALIQASLEEAWKCQNEFHFAALIFELQYEERSHRAKHHVNFTIAATRKHKRTIDYRVKQTIKPSNNRDSKVFILRYARLLHANSGEFGSTVPLNVRVQSKVEQIRAVN